MSAARTKTIGEFVDHMGDMGVKTSAKALANLRGRQGPKSKAPSLADRGRSGSRERGGDDGMEVEGGAVGKARLEWDPRPTALRLLPSASRLAARRPAAAPDYRGAVTSEEAVTPKGRLHHRGGYT